MRSNIVRTTPGARVPDSCVTASTSVGARYISPLHSLAPPGHERVVDPDLVEAARDDEVDEVVDRLRAVVEARRREENDRARFVQRRQSPKMDGGERRLA